MFENLQPKHENTENDKIFKKSMEGKPSIEEILEQWKKMNFESLSDTLKDVFREYSAYEENLQDVLLEIGMVQNSDLSHKEKERELANLTELQQQYGQALSSAAYRLMTTDEVSHRFMENFRKLKKASNEFLTTTPEEAQERASLN